VNALDGADTITADFDAPMILSIDGGAQQDTITVARTATDSAVHVLPSSGDDTVNVNTDGVDVANVSFDSTQRLGALTIGSGGRATFTPGGTKVLTVTSLDIASGGKLDLSDNNAVIDYTGPVGSRLNDLRKFLRDGRLTFSTADPKRRLGYADNAVLHRSDFAGQGVDFSSVLIRYTTAGDADLDGDTDGVDIGAWATNFTGELGGTGSKTWAQGDWDYDGDVDGADAGLWAQAFTGETGGATRTSAQSSMRQPARRLILA